MYMYITSNKCVVIHQLWRLPFAQVIFDSDPATPGKHETLQKEEMSQAMIRYIYCL